MADKDPRTYIRVHDGLDENPKIERLSDAAFRLLISTWCYCSRNLNDGFIADVAWKRRGTPKARRELEKELAHGPGHGCDDCPPVPSGYVYMHDYLTWQRSAEEVADLRRKRSESGRKGGQARARGGATGQASAEANAKAGAEANGQAPAEANPKRKTSKTEAETETETETETEKKTNMSTKAVDESLIEPPALTEPKPDPFDEFWRAYPRRQAKQDAIKAWKQITRDTAAQVVLDGLAGYPFSSDPHFVPLPASWLRGRRWEDEQAASPPQPVAVGNGGRRTHRADGQLMPWEV